MIKKMIGEGMEATLRQISERYPMTAREKLIYRQAFLSGADITLGLIKAYIGEVDGA